VAELATFWQRRSLAFRMGVRFGAALVVVLLPWPGLAHGFGELASSVANAWTAPWLSSSTLLSVRAEGPPDSWNAVLSVGRVDGVYHELLWDLRRTPYLPMAVFTALVAAIPFGRPKRRLLVLAIGLAALQILPGLRLLLLVSADTPGRLVALPRLVQSAVLVACGAFVFPPGMAYVVPSALWVGLMWLFEREALVTGARSLTLERDEASPGVGALTQTSPAHGVVVHRASKRVKTRPPRQRHRKKR
jgi:hypothetical protein